MKNTKDSFLRGRLRSLKFALKGMWLLITTEDSIKAQLFFGTVVVGFGLYFNISNTEWMIQSLIIGMVLVTEALNTAIEKLADFVHPDYHKKIGFIKDIAAGASSFAAFTALIVAGFIYGQRMIELF
ncbi:diacylglycerol kinase family protein [Polaribacter sp.]|jgi:diacylglycerol kinase (ATP)|nr:diacylglycerol kinase family protein [Polaribacter sp.]MDB4171226.1 diacylglycerol kinase family protein [Polaribacter sp.]MDC1373896.1 diacylglycerol kinase family protein [Polaribacter sp.]